MLAGKHRRSVRRRSVSGRRRHVAQHERERGARESRQRAARRQARRRTRPCIRTITSTWRSRTNDTIPTNIRLACLSQLDGLRDGVRGAARRARREGQGVRRHREGRAHAPAGRDADPARPGVHRVRRLDRPRRCGACSEAADYLRDLGIGGSAVGTGVTVEKEYPALMNKHLSADHRARAARRRGPHPAHAEHGRRRRRSARRCACSRST